MSVAHMKGNEGRYLWANAGYENKKIQVGTFFMKNQAYFVCLFKCLYDRGHEGGVSVQ
jgi:hypothetical protein